MDFQSNTTPDNSDLDKLTKLKAYCEVLHIDVQKFHLKYEIEIAFDSDRLSNGLKNALSPLYDSYNVQLSSDPFVGWHDDQSANEVQVGTCLYECNIPYGKLDSLLEILHEHSEAERFRAFSESVDSEIEVELGEDSGKDTSE